MKIKQDTLKNILGTAKAFYPSEVGGILLGKKTIDKYVLIPGKYSPQSVEVKLNQVPIYTNRLGTFHSHPTRNATPSNADRLFFSKTGRIHLILPKPYKPKLVKAYNNRGEEVPLEVVK